MSDAPFALVHGEVHVTVEPAAGGRIAQIEVDGLALLVERCDDPRAWGCYPMAPWAGRVRRGCFTFEGNEYHVPCDAPPHAIHGTTLDRPWRHEGGGRLSIDLGADWPFPGRAVQQLVLDENGLQLRLEVHAEADGFPASVGWHPWFRRQLSRGGTAVLDFEASEMYLRDADGIPDGRTVKPPPGPWDDCFTGVVRGPTIDWKDALQLELSASVDHWVVYDEPEHAVCVEPQTGPPDALNLAPVRVEPGHPLIADARLRFA